MVHTDLDDCALCNDSHGKENVNLGYGPDLQKQLLGEGEHKPSNSCWGLFTVHDIDAGEELLCMYSEFCVGGKVGEKFLSLGN